ncbi:hypothetical protein [Caulobacter sp. LARHSG274]
MIRPNDCRQAFMGRAFDHPVSDRSRPSIDTAMAAGDERPESAPAMQPSPTIDLPPRHPVQTLNSRSVTVRDAWPSTGLISTAVRHDGVMQTGADVFPVAGGRPRDANGRRPRIEAKAALTNPPATRQHH